MTIDEAREAMKTEVPVLYKGSRNYIVSAIIEKIVNGETFYSLELQNIKPEEKNSVTRDGVSVPYSSTASVTANPRAVSCDEPLTKENLFKLARENAVLYPALDKLKEETFGDKQVFKIKVRYGRYDGLIVTFDEALFAALKRKNEYAIVYVKTYGLAWRWILECAVWAKKHKKT